MSYQDRVYKQRLNQYGTTYQERIQKQRERQFGLYLKSSNYRVEFEYNGATHVGSFERSRQDNTRTLQYLLTPFSLKLPGGTLVEISRKDGVAEQWMVFYWEQIQARGYNRHIMLRMTHFIEWTDQQGNKQSSHVYMYGQENNMLRDEIRSRSRMNSLYSENLKLSFFIMPRHAHLLKDDYLLIGEPPFEESYRVTGYDRQSTEGVEFVSVDPVYKYDLTPRPTPASADNADDFFWFGGE